MRRFDGSLCCSLKKLIWSSNCFTYLLILHRSNSYCKKEIMYFLVNAQAGKWCIMHMGPFSRIPRYSYWYIPRRFQGVPRQDRGHHFYTNLHNTGFVEEFYPLSEGGVVRYRLHRHMHAPLQISESYNLYFSQWCGFESGRFCINVGHWFRVRIFLNRSDPWRCVSRSDSTKRA